MGDSKAKRTGLSRDVGEAVGQVPIVRLNRVSPLCARHDFYLKLESCNPGGSIKEKNAVYLIDDAERSGLLRPGGVIVESSSGNFGIALAMIAAARGYRVIIVVDAKTPARVRLMLRSYGAEIAEVPMDAMDAHGSMQEARMKKAAELARRIPGAWYVCQHTNPKNPDAHAMSTAREIEEAFDPLPDVIVVGVSTGGQLAGISRRLRERRSSVRLVAVDVAGSAILGTPRHSYKMTGLGLSFIPPCFDPAVLDAAYSVNDRLAFSFCHALARQEGLLLGSSTGAIVAAGLAYAARASTRLRVLMINPDRGDRYLETVYNEGWLKENGIGLLVGDELEAGVNGLAPVSPPIPTSNESYS